MRIRIDGGRTQTAGITVRIQVERTRIYTTVIDIRLRRQMLGLKSRICMRYNRNLITHETGPFVLFVAPLIVINTFCSVLQFT